MTKAEIEAYVSSPLYHERVFELVCRLETEPLTVEESAKIVGLPVDVFINVWSHVMAWDAVKPTLGTEH